MTTLLGAGSTASQGGPHARHGSLHRATHRREPRLSRVPTRPMSPSREMPGFRGLSHLTPAGEARMVDVSAKSETVREAAARVTLKMKATTLAAVRAGQLAKGDVLGVARTAGIMAAKRTPDLIPLCHPLRITGVDVEFALDSRRSTITVHARVRTVDKTGVEMEALTAAAVAGLTVYDMVKAVDKGIVLTDLCLVEKSGGKSGTWTRGSGLARRDRKSTRLNSSHLVISYAVFCLKKKKKTC